ncbi:hypothetical protein [Streptomyces brasiliscabiei]|uniref:hypothetical protein n=1 Tax=Streptomyces brasiliscabiei TaxID=2736302 RepID=UPI001C11D08B|nr:hypothetical protein [Streptomyces brasiliscabiei]
MSQPQTSCAGDDRARTHIKALVAEAKFLTEGTAGTPVMAFGSGMLTGLAASVQVLDGGTAEAAMETIVQRLEAAVGKAYLEGTLPPKPPAPATRPGPALASFREQLAAPLDRILGDWPSHNRADEHEAVRNELLEAVLGVVLPEVRVVADRARGSEATVQRVIDLYERWVKAGPPPLGVSVSRWWDARLVELHHAVLPPADAPKDPS